MGSSALPLRASFSGGDDHADAIAALALAPFVTGDNPFVEEFDVAACGGPPTWSPSGRSCDASPPSTSSG
jgi:hypothetical protein